MDSARAREVAEQIVHPYFGMRIATALRNLRQLTEGLDPGSMSAVWTSEKTDRGYVEISTWGLGVRGPWGVQWRNYDETQPPGNLTDTVFIPWENVEAVEAALREIASG